MSAKAQWRYRSRNANGTEIILRWKIFAAGSARASQIAKCWRVWLRRAHSIFLVASAQNSSYALMNRWLARRRRIAIARQARFHYLTKRQHQSRRQESEQSSPGANTKSFLTKK